MIFNETIKPYIGTDSFKLYESIEEAKITLKENKIEFKFKKYPNKDCTPPEPWTEIEIPNVMTLFFTDKNNKLFKIAFENKYKGKLENGVDFNWTIDDVKKIDDTLEYEDFEEIWLSKKGYWLENTCDGQNKIFSIQIFIKEINDKDFASCNW